MRLVSFQLNIGVNNKYPEGGRNLQRTMKEYLEYLQDYLEDNMFELTQDKFPGFNLSDGEKLIELFEVEKKG